MFKTSITSLPTNCYYGLSARGEAEGGARQEQEQEQERKQGKAFTGSLLNEATALAGGN